MMGMDGESLNRGSNKEIFDYLKNKIQKMPMNEVSRKLRLSGIIPFLGGRPEMKNELSGEIIVRGKKICKEDISNLLIAIAELERNIAAVGEMVKVKEAKQLMSEDLAWSIFFQNT